MIYAKSRKPLVLMILDGWGYGSESYGNAIIHAVTPNFDNLWQKYPHTLLSASGLDVGLPKGQMGNSEVGHLHIGAGRQVLQDLAKIDAAIESGKFFENQVFNTMIRETIKAEGALHILGLLSEGGVHSHISHLEAMVELAMKKGLDKVYVHAFLDGRDTSPKSAMGALDSMLTKMEILKGGKIVSLVGRYYAMDRDKRWDRVILAYDLLTLGRAEYRFSDAKSGLEAAYNRGEIDEFVKPTIICESGHKPITIEDNDTVVFMNFRADRARELSYAFVDNGFGGFTRTRVPRLNKYVTLTEYADDLQVELAYPKDKLSNTLGEVLSQHGLSQLRIAETEKYAHVTYFINGGKEAPFEGEDRILVQSPKLATYDLQPEMSAVDVTDKLVTAIRMKKYDVIICNYANPDMVGHSGNFEATVNAVETIDKSLGRVVNVLQEYDGEMIVLADHGNAEEMINLVTGETHTAHTTNPVPFIYMGRKAVIVEPNGRLSNVAPTLLNILNLEKPEEMTENSLIKI